MARISLEVCLMTLIALSVVYETQGEIPKMSKDFVPYAHQNVTEFLRSLEGLSPATVEFKDLFAKLRDYVDYCFKPTSPGSKDIQIETSGKFEPLFRAISALNGTKNGTSLDSWRLIDVLVSMEMVSLEMKKKTWNEIINSYQRKKLYGASRTWVGHIGLFVKKVSEMKGKSIDLHPFNLNNNYAIYDKLSKKADNTTQEAFSLPLYLEKFPKMRKDFESFAYKGMFDFVDDLESKCLGSIEFKNFFANLKDYMAYFKSVDPYEYRFDQEYTIEWNAGKLYIAIYALNATKAEPLDSWRLVNGLRTMANVLVEMKRNGSTQITFEQRRELTWSMVKWARGISLFVKTISEKKGIFIDLTSFEKYYDSHVLVPSKGSGDTTIKDHPNDGNIPKDKSANNNSSSNKPKESSKGKKLTQH